MGQKIAIVTDSTADLPREIVVNRGITVVPLDVRFGDLTFRAGVELSNDDFMTRLRTSTLVPTTSHPPPARFEESFRQLAAEHDAIVAVLLSAKLGGTVNAATRAAAAVADLIPVEVVDSRSGSMGLGFQVLRAADLAERDVAAAALGEILRSELGRYHVVFFVDTLDFLQRGGRIARAAALIGGVLQLKPLLRIDEGQVVPWERTRTRSRATAELIDYVAALPSIDRVAALYSSDRTAGLAFADRIASELGLPRERVVVSQIGPIVATHIGPGALGIAAVEAPV